MNWFKKASIPPVYITKHDTAGMTVFIQNSIGKHVEYYCPNYNPITHNKLQQLINQKRWGEAKNLCGRLKCLNEEEEKKRFKIKQNDPQLNLFE